MVLLELLKTMRPHQWVKNLFVVAPLIFAERAGEVSNLRAISMAFGLFCVFSGCVYILNDLLDVVADRLHPVKRHRPIPAGRFPVPWAWSSLALLLVASTSLAYQLSPTLSAIGVGYFLLNVAYSTVLKHVPFVDVSVIAAGFVLRIYGGAASIDVPLSFWLILCTFLLAAFLGLGKRKHELIVAGEAAAQQRRVLRYYRLGVVTPVMEALAAVTVASYAGYILMGETVQVFRPMDLLATIPCVAFGLWRFSALTERHGGGKSPTDLMLVDKPFIANLVVWLAIVVVVIYGL